jgi:hypothetical protein
MLPRDAEPPVALTARADGAAAEAPVGEMTAQLREILGPAEESARGMLEAEEALRVAHELFEHTEDPEVQAELAADALDHVERQLQLTQERRRQLDSIEAKLWARQSRLEGFLITTRGSGWWRARRDRGRAERVTAGRVSVSTGR